MRKLDISLQKAAKEMVRSLLKVSVQSRFITVIRKKSLSMKENCSFQSEEYFAAQEVLPEQILSCV